MQKLVGFKGLANIPQPTAICICRWDQGFDLLIVDFFLA